MLTGSSLSRAVRGRRSLSSRLLLAAVSLAALACASGCHGDTDFDVKQANDFAPSGRVTVSVLGVFKDGLMSRETWETLGPKLSPALAAQNCATRYDAAFVEANKGVAAAVEDYTRANGITEPLLTAFSSGAEGDVMMILTVSGRAFTDNTYHHENAPMPGLAPAAGRQGGGTGNGYGGGFGNSSSPASPGFGRSAPLNPPNASGSMYEIAATFYSVKEKKPVAALTMKYTGPREEDAIQRFAGKLHAYLPNATCVGFKADSGLTEERVRELPAAE